ncbi:MAG: type II toxin-antitoxin system HicB family antitoxin [Mariniphaga sp.]|nr:type II toxin-antitoxin system HicB family antitoxin [Mariniphaga sp.]
MEKVDVLVRPNNEGWWAEVTSLPGCFSAGDNIGDLKKNIAEAIDLHIEGLLDDDLKISDELIHGQYELELHINLQDLFEHFPLTITGVAKRAGMNRTLLNQYARGEKTMSENQALRITEAIQKIGSELAELQF